MKTARPSPAPMSTIARAHPDTPVMALDPAQIDIFTHQGPHAFHQRLREMLRNARRRIVLASLYWGTGALERELVDDIRHALERHSDLRVEIVIDYCRGRRRTDNGTSVTFLAGLLAAYPERVRCYLHRMPQFAGPLALLPSPLDECIAVCHVKTLLADDQAIVTGANLSDEYFHSRQARYLTVRDARFADLSQAIVDITATHSVRVRAASGGSIAYTSPARPADELYRSLCQLFAQMDRAEKREGASEGPAHDDAVFLTPMFQHPALGVQEERALVRTIFARTDGALIINTPYPNFPDDYVRALCQRLAAGCRDETLVISPSDDCHGFSTGRGLKALVPGVYMEREREFVEALERAAHQGMAQAPRFEHYQRDGWVFHSKGVWLETQDQTATVIGSSSFGERSVTRDYDLSYYLVTRDAALRQDLEREIATMRAHTSAARTHKRPTSRLVPLLAPLVKPFL